MRLGRRNFALALLPIMILTYYGPLYAMLEWNTNTGREAWLFVWQMFPIWVMLGGILSSFVVPDTTVSDRFNAPDSDLPIIRYTIGTLVTISSVSWSRTYMTSPYNMLSIFMPETLPTNTKDFVSFTREFLRVDGISLFGHTFLWLGYLFWDLKHAGMVQAGWLKISLYFVCSLVAFGPGATAGLGWLWRENVLATTRHKDAIVAKDVGEKEQHVSNGSAEKTPLE